MTFDKSTANGNALSPCVWCVHFWTMPSICFSVTLKSGDKNGARIAPTIIITAHSPTIHLPHQSIS